MKLKKFRVTNFRSVEDSDWIEVNDVTALIGTNESGKTNILLPLWKLNPAKDGDITPTSDYPRKLYNQIRGQTPKPIFIRAIFEIDNDLAEKLSELTNVPAENLQEVEAYRRFDGPIKINFPNIASTRLISYERINEVLTLAESEIKSLPALKSEEEQKKTLLSSISHAISIIQNVEHVGLEQLQTVQTVLMENAPTNSLKTSTIAPRYTQVCEEIDELLQEVKLPHPSEVKSVIELVTSNLPKFVYYSTYGNLDSEIYLPHVISNLNRTDLGLKEQAKARTLKVLFEFVRLSAEEIRQLGNDFKDPNRAPTESEIAVIAEKKKERSILLQSASSLLTQKFREWWKQGEYRFRFEADGDHFRIWVSDDKRPEEVELEGRSTGLQWFLSFYLVFLVEKADTHEGAILLLDEPGLSLHPLAQKDLSIFFDGLASDNQLLYTCHSPFLVDADRLDRARKVYVGKDGTSKVSSDLRAADDDIGQRGAAYAVHAALGLSVAESLLLGCLPVVVEGPSDQHYLTGIKNVLIANGRLKPGRELIFPPAGGAKGVKAVASILIGRDDMLPTVLLDSDKQGQSIANSLKNDLYADCPNLVLGVGSFIDLPNAETEDLFPPQLIAKLLDKWQRSSDVTFESTLKDGPITQQIEAWAQKYNVPLPSGWKVELSKRVKQYLLDKGSEEISLETLDRWSNLFAKFQLE